MGNSYVLTLQPTFTQGLILGQLSILVLLGLILKYLFLHSSDLPTYSYHPRVDSDARLRSHKFTIRESPEDDAGLECSAESTEWFNMLLQRVHIFILYLAPSNPQTTFATGYGGLPL
jgi:maintenance of morphology protein 1